jgi:hypothetical protein
MKKLAFGLVITMLLVPAVMADQIQIGYDSSPYGQYQTGSGGEFTLNPINLTRWLDLSGYKADTKDVGVAGTFQSFCVEGLEYIYPYPATYDAVKNTAAVWGSVGPLGDPISVGTGWLYAQFATEHWVGGLSYDYLNTSEGRKTDAGLLQNAIWWLEGEEDIVYDINHPNKYIAAVINEFHTEVGAKADGGEKYGVYVLNLTSGSTLAQDQLWMDPSGGVPDGGMTVVLLGLAIACLAFIFRRTSN